MSEDVDYVGKIADIVDAQDMFIQGISFTENAIQFEYLDKRRQSENVMTANITMVGVTDKSRLEFYDQVQDLSLLILREALVEERLSQ